MQDLIARKLLIPMLMSFGMSCSTGNNLSCEILRLIEAGTIMKDARLTNGILRLPNPGKRTNHETDVAIA